MRHVKLVGIENGKYFLSEIFVAWRTFMGVNLNLNNECQKF